MKSLNKSSLALLAVALLDAIALVFTWSKYTHVANNLNAHASSLGPLWMGWIQTKNLQHFMLVEGGILILAALFFTLWIKQDRKHVIETPDGACPQRRHPFKFRDEHPQ